MYYLKDYTQINVYRRKERFLLFWERKFLNFKQVLFVQCSLFNENLTTSAIVKLKIIALINKYSIYIYVGMRRNVNDL